MPSTARYTLLLIVRHRSEDLSSTNTTQTASATVRRWYERIATEITHRCRDFIILVDPTANIIKTLL